MHHIDLWPVSSDVVVDSARQDNVSTAQVQSIRHWRYSSGGSNVTRSTGSIMRRVQFFPGTRIESGQ
jgi:hypothetical protein